MSKQDVARVDRTITLYPVKADASQVIEVHLPIELMNGAVILHRELARENDTCIMRVYTQAGDVNV